MDVKKSKKNALIAASVAGLLAVSGFAMSKTAFAEDDVNCAGVNACSGKGQCGSKTGGNSCAGKNSCKGKGVVMVSKAACDALGGTVEAAKA